MLPYSLGSSLASMPAAWFIAYRQRKGESMSAQKGVISLGLAISIVGFGMFSSVCQLRTLSDLLSCGISHRPAYHPE